MPGYGWKNDGRTWFESNGRPRRFTKRRKSVVPPVVSGKLDRLDYRPRNRIRFRCTEPSFVDPDFVKSCGRLRCFHTFSLHLALAGRVFLHFRLMALTATTSPAAFSTFAVTTAQRVCSQLIACPRSTRSPRTIARQTLPFCWWSTTPS